MPPSNLFWTETLLGAILSLTGGSMLLVVLGVGLRQRLYQNLSGVTAGAGLFGLGAAVANITFWLKTNSASGDTTFSSGVGRPLFWLELAVAGLLLASAALLRFAFDYVETPSSEVPLSEPRRHAQHRWLNILPIAGFVVVLALLPPLFDDAVVNQMYFDQAGILRSTRTSLGNIALVIPLVLQLGALLAFWSSGSRPGKRALAASIAIWLLGGTATAILDLPLFVEQLTLGSSIFIIGYVLLHRQIVNPIRAQPYQLERALQNQTPELEETRARLKRLAEQQRQATQIAREIARSRDPGTLLSRLAEMIHSQLGYHHIFVYQLDDTERFLVVRAAAGTTSQTLVTSGHRLQVGGRSVAGRSAAEKRALLLEAKDDDAIYFEAAALPAARSELVAPMMAGDQFFGVLDLQSIHYNAFSDQDLSILTSLADQVAILLENGRLYQETKAALAELQEVRHRTLRQAWNATLDRSEQPAAFVFTEGEGIVATDLQTAWSPEISEAVTTGPVVPGGMDGDLATFSLPILVQGQPIGALRLRHKPGRRWRPEERDVLVDLADRLGLALETVRLSQDAKLRASRERLIGQFASHLHETLDLETILRSATQEIREALQLPEVVIRLVDPQSLEKNNGYDESPDQEVRQ